MQDRISSNPLDYIMPLNMNKLEGRMMIVPGPKNKQSDILLVPDAISMLERWWSLADNLADYATVTVPDLPGIGGMDSFISIGINPNIDSYADYLAAFIKLRFKRKKILIVGYGFGFAITTKMLQKYPELNKKIDFIVAISGYVHKDDFTYSRFESFTYHNINKLLALRPVYFIFKPLLTSFILDKFIKKLVADSSSIYKHASKQEKLANQQFLTRILTVNDLRSNLLIIREILSIDLCHKRIDVPLINIATKQQKSLNSQVNEEHLQVIYKLYKRYLANNTPEAYSIIADKKMVGKLLPQAFRRILSDLK